MPPKKVKSKYKLENPIDRRKAESQKIRTQYPDRVPVICEKAERANVPDIDKSKFLVPQDLSVGQFKYVVQKRLKVDHSKAIFLFIDGNLLATTQTPLAALYAEHKDEDGFLYVTYSSEDSFGTA